MIKVVYFDDKSVTDYLVTYDGGEKIQSSENVKRKSKDIASKTSAKVSAKLGWLPVIGVSAETGANADFSFNTDSFVTTTLSNTVLSDFLEKVKGESPDSRIARFKGFTLKAYKNSIAFFKAFTPYLKMVKYDITTDEGLQLDITKLDEAFVSGKGYYELIAENESLKYIFRFNISAFRNNYGIADLSKMNLCYYAIKVGAADERMLDISKEFDFEQEPITSAYDLENQDCKKDTLEVYDVLLAGIEG